VSLLCTIMFVLDSLLEYIVVLSFAATASAFIAYYFKFPSILTHIVAGILIGPFVLGIVEDKEAIQKLGEFGIILLLFFIGMEISLRHLMKYWRIILLATILHAVVSVGVIYAFGALLDWPTGRSILLGMVISLSSTAVLLRYLEEQKILQTKLGNEVIGILLTQDIMVIPMLLIIDMLSPHAGTSLFSKQLLVSLLLISIVIMIGRLSVPKLRHTKSAQFFVSVVNNAEAGLFVGIALCFGCALISSLLNLSAGLGAFLAGIIFAGLHMPRKVRKRMVSFKIFFMMMFFMSIGMLIDIPFFVESWPIVLFMVSVVFVFNTIVRAIFFISLGASWRYSLYASSLLAHVGEFSFFIATAGYGSGLISNFSYQLTIIMIAVSILISPLWIKMFSYVHPKENLYLEKPA
jgi:CPA2 family monovalent cation:H+ antiporter-2